MSKLAILGGNPVADLSCKKSGKFLRNHDIEKENLLKVYESGDWSTNSCAALNFETLWAEYNTSRYCSLVTNGTHALQLALESLEIGWGSEVIVPGITWQATAGAVCDVNAVPVLADIDKETLCIDVKMAEKAITAKTKAIICVHLYNRLVDMSELLKLTQKYNLWLIEDCSHCHGSKWRGKGAGSIGKLGTYSFQSSKLMQCAEGGAVLTQDEKLFCRLMSLRNCGREYLKSRVHSGNYRMTGFQAAILLAQLEILKYKALDIDHVGRMLDNVLKELPGVQPLKRNPDATCQTGYGYAFTYNPEDFDGLPAEKFRNALSVELGLDFTSTYTPLNMSEVYFPHLKQRHSISKSYLNKINPLSYELPVAFDMWQNRAVVTRWHIFDSSTEEISHFGDAIQKIYENRKDLF